MPIGAILLAGSTVASLALPFFFPAPTAQAKPTDKTIQTTQSNLNGRKILLNPNTTKIDFPKPVAKSIDPDNKKKIGLIAIIIVVIIIAVLVLR